jgi:DNA-directed RNA polymerase subunit RPC12/RpoP
MNKQCQKCGSENIIMIEYRMTTEDYDGVSEIKCQDCGARYGRWSLRELGGGELEPIYGRKR